MKKNCFGEAQEENMSKMHALRNFWCDLGSFEDVDGVILVILECRITVCYKTVSQIRKRVIASVELHV